MDEVEIYYKIITLKKIFFYYSQSRRDIDDDVIRVKSSGPL